MDTDRKRRPIPWDARSLTDQVIVEPLERRLMLSADLSSETCYLPQTPPDVVGDYPVTISYPEFDNGFFPEIPTRPTGEFVGDGELVRIEVGSWLVVEGTQNRTNGDPQIPFTMTDTMVRFTDLPVDFAVPTFNIPEINAFDDNADGLIDGFGIDAVLQFGQISLGIAGNTLVTLDSLELGVQGLEVRASGVRTGSLIFNAGGLEILPDAGTQPIALPGVGSIDINTGAFTLDLTIPPGTGESLTFNGLVPFELSHIGAIYTPGADAPDASFEVTGTLSPDTLATRIGSAIGSPGLTIGLEVFDGSAFVPAAPLTLGLTYNANGFRLTGTPPIRLSIANLDVPLPSSLGDLQLAGFLAIGGLDGTGLPTPMPAGTGYEGQQVAGSILAFSDSTIGTVSGSLAISGGLTFDNGTSNLDLDISGTLSGSLTLNGFAGSGSFDVDLSLPIAVTAGAGDPQFAGSITVNSFNARDLDLTVADLLRIQIGSISYVASPPSGSPVATMSAVTLTFTDLPAGLANASIVIDDVDGYDDNADGVIDGFGVTTAINLADVSLGLSGETLVTLQSLQLVVTDLQVRPEHTVTRSGTLVFNASGLDILPGTNPGGTPADLPAVATVDVQTGAFTLDLTVPANLSEALTFNAIIPFELSHIGASYTPTDAGADATFLITGTLRADTLASNIETAIGAPGLTIGIEVFNGSSFVPAAPLTLGIAYTDNTLRLTDTPSVRLSIASLSIPLPSSLGDLQLAGFLAVGGLNSSGFPEPMPAGTGYGGLNVAGSLFGLADTSIGTVNGSLMIAGTIALDGTSTTLDLSIAGALAGNVLLDGFTGTGSFETDVSVQLIVDNDDGAPQFSGSSAVDSFRATDLDLTIAEMLRIQVDSITYTSGPQPGDPIATASNITGTVLGVFADAGLTASIDVDLYDDDGDGVIDGFGLTNAQFAFAQNQSWDYGPGPLLRVEDLTATFAGYVYRPEATGTTIGGTIDLALGSVELYPDGGGAFTATLSNATGSIDPADGSVSINIGRLQATLGNGGFFQVELLDTTLILDADEATDILSVASASLTLDDALNELDGLEFELTGFRFNILADQPVFGVDAVTLSSSPGILASLGLAGVLPFDINDATLTFADSGAYSDFTNFTLDVSGGFDIARLEQLLPFTPVLSIGQDPGDQPGGFTFSLAFDAVQRRVQIVNLADITLGFSGFEIGELVFAGEITLDGIVGGVLQPGVGGFIAVDTASSSNRVQPSGGTGVDFYGTQIDLAGSITRAGNVTNIVIDANASVSFDLQLGDFLALSDLGFVFGLDIAATDGWAANPQDDLSVTPRLEQMTVGAITASVGDFIELGAQNITIDFDPAPGQPLATLDFSIESQLVGVGGSIDTLAILQGGVPDFGAIDRVDVAILPGSPLADLFAEFLPLSVNSLGFAFKPGFFDYAPGGSGFSGIRGIADPTALNLFVSGRAGTPDWLPEDFTFDVGTDFTDLEIDLPKLINGEFPIVSLDGLSFEVGIDFGVFTVGGALSVGVVDADPDPIDVENVYYAAIKGAFELGDYGATGSIALTTAGPIGATVSVPLAIVLGQTGITISGAAGSIQFGTVVLPDPDQINSPSDLSDIPNPFDVDLTDTDAIRTVIHRLWDESNDQLRYTFTEPATLALQGELTHVAVAGMITGTATVAANVSLPIGGNQAAAGLALLGFGDINAMGIPVADAKLLFDLRDALNPTVGFYFQAPATGNPLGTLFPAQADFGVVLKTDGLAMATAVGLRAVFTEVAAGTLAQGQLFFEQVASTILTVLQSDPTRSALADLLAPHLPGGTTFADLDTNAFIALLTGALELDDVLSALGSGGGQDVSQIPQDLQDKLNDVIALAEAATQDLTTFMPVVIANGINDANGVATNLVDLGLRNAGQINDPLDPLGLLTSFDPAALGIDRVIPLEYISEATSLFVNSVSAAVRNAILDTTAFVVSDAFNPRLLVEGEFVPMILGVPAGEPAAGVQMTISKRGISYGFSASILRTLQLVAASGAGGGGFSPLLLAVYPFTTRYVSDTTTVAYELPFNSLQVLQDLTQGGVPLAGLNPFSPEWGILATMNIISGGFSTTASFAQFGPGSTLLENNVQIVDSPDDPVDADRIPVTSQALLDRMLSLGGLLYSTGVLQPRLLTDPFGVIGEIIADGGELVEGETEIDRLMNVFADGPSFLESVQDSLTEVNELARAQMYLPISYATLLPDELQAFLENGDTEGFNQAFEQVFYNPDGTVNESAVSAALDKIVTMLADGASEFAGNFFIEGNLNLNVPLLGINFGNGRLFAGVLPDPDNPGQDLNFGNTAITVTGSIPWLADLAVEAVLDTREFDLTADPRLATLRDAFGDFYRMPRGTFSLMFDTATQQGADDVDLILQALGLPVSVQLPAGTQTMGSLRAYTPGFDLDSADPLLRVGGLEFAANLDIAGLVDDAAFTFRVTPPTAGSPLTFRATASVNEITVGGFSITGAQIVIVNDGSGVTFEIDGTVLVLGSALTVDGTLDSSLQGNLDLTFQGGGDIPSGFFGGLDATGSLNLTRDAAGTRAVFAGTIDNLPGGAGGIGVTGRIDDDGTFALTTGATNLTLAGFTITGATLALTGNSSSFVVDFGATGNGSTSLLNTTFDLDGSFGSAGGGILGLTLTGTAPSFNGFSGNGTFTLNVDGTGAGSVGFDGTISGLPGNASIAMTGHVTSPTNFDVTAAAADMMFDGFTIAGASVRFYRDGAESKIELAGAGTLDVLGTSFMVGGLLETTGYGSLSMSAGGGPPSGFFGGLDASGSFELVNDATGARVAFAGSVSNVPGNAGSIGVTGRIDDDGTFTLDTNASSLTLAGFTITNAILELTGTSSTFSVNFGAAGTGSLSLLSTTFKINGSMSSNGAGTLGVVLTGAAPRFNGFTGVGAFTLNLTSASVGSLSFNGTIYGLPGDSVLSMNGDIFSATDFDLYANATTNLNFAGFNVNGASVEFYRVSGISMIQIYGSGAISAAGANFTVGGQLTTAGFGNLTMTLSSGSPGFGDFDASGTFTLDVNGSSAAIVFSGSIDNIPDLLDDVTLSGTLTSSGSFSLTGSVTDLRIAPNGDRDVGDIFVDVSGGLTLTGSPGSSVSLFGTGPITAQVSRADAGPFRPITTPLFDEFTINSLEIRSNGYVDFTVTNFLLEFGIFDFTASSISFLNDPNMNAFMFTVVGPTLSVSNVFNSGSWSRSGFGFGIDLNFDADFDAQIIDGNNPWSFGGFTLTGTDIWFRSSVDGRGSRTFQVQIEDDSGRTSRLVLLGNLNDLTSSDLGFSLPDIFISSDGTFSASISNPAIGVTGFNITAPSMVFEKTSGSFGTLRLNIPSPTINLPLGGSAPLGEAIQFEEDGTLYDSVFGIATSLLDFGTAFYPTSTTNMDFIIRTTSSGWEFTLNDAVGPSIQLTTGSGTVRLKEFTVDSNGNFSGRLNGTAGVMVNGQSYQLASGDLDLTRTSTYVSLDVDRLSINNGFFNTTVDGYIRSNGDFNLAGTASISTGIAILVAPPGTNLSGASATVSATADVDLDSFFMPWDIELSGRVLVRAGIFTLLDINGTWDLEQDGDFTVFEAGGFDFWTFRM